MQQRGILIVGILLLSLLQSITAATSASAATSYLNSNTYYAYETFLTNGTWSRPFGVTEIDYLVVAGGGRGGGSQLSTHYAGGGGGGGGVRYGTLSIAQSSYTIIVGAGQTAGCSQGRGGNSSISGTDISTISATGGGSGSCNASSSAGGGGIDAYSGGSGGGAGAQVYANALGSGNFGGYTPSEGNSGGSAFLHTTNAIYQGGGGGGGATQSGGNATSGCAGKGGNGYTSTITGNSVTYGGGGGGGSRMHSCGGAAGTGGGGSGGLNGEQGSAGTDGLGGGGGGTSLSNGNRGGNGTVIVRYLLSAPNTPDLPSASDTGQSSTDNITASTSFTLTGSAIGGSSVQIYDAGIAIGSPCTANMTTGVYSCTVSGLTDGVHTFTSKASFNGGAAITSSGSLQVTVDSTIPTFTPAAAISVAENQTSITTITASETVTLSMTGGADSLTVVFDTSTGNLSFISPPDYENPLDSDGNGIYSVTITVIDFAGNYRWRTFSITVTDINEVASLSIPTVSGALFKGVPTTVSVSSLAAGKVRFFIDGKRIPSCLARNTSGSYPTYTATCTFKPAVTGRHAITASITPTSNTFGASTSAPAIFLIQKRITTR